MEELETDPKTEEVTEENDNELNKGTVNECTKINNSFEHSHTKFHTLPMKFLPPQV